MIKKYCILLYIIGSALLCFAQPKIQNLNFPKSADIYSLYEISFQLGAYDNPYDPEVIDVYAIFTGPDGQTRRVIGFYCEGYQFTKEKIYEVSSRNRDGDSWRIRFTPDTAGQWTYVIYAVDKTGQTQLSSYKGNTLAFDCLSKDAEGFITTANTKYLKRDAIVNGQRQPHLFFPIGPNIAWYGSADYGIYRKPLGIYDYDNYIQRLSGNANYFRIWLNRYQYLSLYGAEHAGTIDGKPRMHFDNSINQKDAAELDHIVQRADEHGIALMACIFNFRNFQHKNSTSNGTAEHPARPSDWINNPFNTVLRLHSKYDFFTDPRAIRIEKNLIRYIVARWGYATNIMCWELWNEVANMASNNDLTTQVQRDMVLWHKQMAEYIRSIDPYHHLISTSLGWSDDIYTLTKAFNDMDIVQDHNYQNIQKSNSNEQFSYVLLKKTIEAKQHYPRLPFFMGEFAFGLSNTKITYQEKDPKGVDLHNSLWSSAFSGALGPASFWYWEALDELNWYGLFKPVTTFFNTMPVLSDSFSPKTTGTSKERILTFPNNLETYYMVNASEDTLLGWCQDTAFCYQSLRWLSGEVSKNGHFVEDCASDREGYLYTLDPAKRPKPSSRSNRLVLPLEHQPRGTRYRVRWFDAETGLELTDEATTVTVRRPWFRSRRIIIEFPSSIRDIDNGHINNTFGDAVFLITKE